MENHALTTAPAKHSLCPGSSLEARLRQLGFDFNAAGDTCRAPHGVSERVAIHEVLENADKAEDLVVRLSGYAARGVPVCLSAADFRDDATAVANWEDFCRLLRDAGRSRNLGALGFCVHSHQLPLDTYCAIADSAFGQGPRYVFLDSLQMRSHSDARVEARTRNNWTFLWRQRRAERPVLAVYGGFVRSACPLLAEEVAISVLPECGLQAPLDSAWLPVGLDLLHFADRYGRLDEERLHGALQQAVTFADALIDSLTWATSAQNRDARENRRIALVLGGIGDLVLRRGDNPAELGCLRQLGDTLGRLRKALDSASAALAGCIGGVPSLSRACPPGEWFHGPHGVVWRTRFEAACRKAAVRHRNLLVMSPYSVLPSCDRVDPAFADLLPLLGYADAWSFAVPPALSGWNVTQFEHFHKRARAVIQDSQVSAFVAAGV